MAQAEELFEQQKYQDAFNTAQKAYKLSGDNVKYEDFSRKIRSVYKDLHADRETGC